MIVSLHGRGWLRDEFIVGEFLCEFAIRVIEYRGEGHGVLTRFGFAGGGEVFEFLLDVVDPLAELLVIEGAADEVGVDHWGDGGGVAGGEVFSKGLLVFEVGIVGQVGLQQIPDCCGDEFIKQGEVFEAIPQLAGVYLEAGGGDVDDGGAMRAEEGGDGFYSHCFGWGDPLWGVEEALQPDRSGATTIDERLPDGVELFRPPWPDR